MEYTYVRLINWYPPRQCHRCPALWPDSPSSASSLSSSYSRGRHWSWWRSRGRRRELWDQPWCGRIYSELQYTDNSPGCQRGSQWSKVARCPPCRHTCSAAGPTPAWQCNVTGLGRNRNMCCYHRDGGQSCNPLSSPHIRIHSLHPPSPPSSDRGSPDSQLWSLPPPSSLVPPSLWTPCVCRRQGCWRDRSRDISWHWRGRVSPDTVRKSQHDVSRENESFLMKLYSIDSIVK